MTSCPICRSAEAMELVSLSGRALRRCSQCHHGFLEVAATNALEAIYNDHYAGFRSDPIFQREAGRVLREDVHARVSPPAHVLDVGCGNGEFLALAQDSGYRVTGIDISEAAVEMCRRRGIVDVRIGDLRSPVIFDAEERFDLITFWDVVEHLPDPGSFLRRGCELLVPGGHLLVKTPLTTDASLRVTARIPRLAGPLLQVPSHIQFFKREGLSLLLRDAGFATQHWLPSRPMRSSADGGPLRRRIARQVTRGLHTLARDGNLLVLARRD